MAGVRRRRVDGHRGRPLLLQQGRVGIVLAGEVERRRVLLQHNANQALDRVLHFFPEDRREQLLMDLSLNMKAMVAQQLIPTPDGKGRRAAVEILINTPLAKELIRKGEIHKLKELMKKSTNLGMKTFDQALFELYQAGEITYEDALRHADSANEVRLAIKLSQGGDANTLAAGLDGIGLQEDR